MEDLSVPVGRSSSISPWRSVYGILDLRDACRTETHLEARSGFFAAHLVKGPFLMARCRHIHQLLILKEWTLLDV
ncbi:hypothetical protein ILYODFUR_020474 [Ilyodon furcidens]|uniref:Uncharacterized protein n=1 Tax=Ilyodon furcidens TaxID=33524 RepID=A0ABV0V5E2_9TELE